MQIQYSPRFQKQYKDLSKTIKLVTEKRELLFRSNPFALQLRTHKLKGRLNGLWAFSIDYKYRVIFEFIENDIVRFHSVGDHKIYYR